MLVTLLSMQLMNPDHNSVYARLTEGRGLKKYFSFMLQSGDDGLQPRLVNFSGTLECQAFYWLGLASLLARGPLPW